MSSIIAKNLLKQRLTNVRYQLHQPVNRDVKATMIRSLSGTYEYEGEPTASHVKRPAGVRMGWSKNVIAELLPFTSELIAVRGRPLENIAVGYCVTTPVMDIPDAVEGQMKTQRRV